jgi:hypothetical protein
MSTQHGSGRNARHNANHGGRVITHPGPDDLFLIQVHALQYAVRILVGCCVSRAIKSETVTRVPVDCSTSGLFVAALSDSVNIDGRLLIS